MDWHDQQDLKSDGAISDCKWISTLAMKQKPHVDDKDSV